MCACVRLQKSQERILCQTPVDDWPMPRFSRHVEMSTLLLPLLSLEHCIVVKVPHWARRQFIALYNNGRKYRTFYCFVKKACVENLISLIHWCFTGELRGTFLCHMYSLMEWNIEVLNWTDMTDWFYDRTNCVSCWYWVDKNLYLYGNIHKHILLKEHVYTGLKCIQLNRLNQTPSAPDKMFGLDKILLYRGYLYRDNKILDMWSYSLKRGFQHKGV